MSGAILLIVAALLFLLGDYLVRYAERLEPKKPEPKRNRLARYDNSKDWIYSDDDSDFVDWEEVE